MLKLHSDENEITQINQNVSLVADETEEDNSQLNASAVDEPATVQFLID
jgi:hypothetical protein